MTQKARFKNQTPGEGEFSRRGFYRLPHGAVEKVVRIFDSFEEADAEDALSRAGMTPQERVDIFFELRERAHPDAFN